MGGGVDTLMSTLYAYDDPAKAFAEAERRIQETVETGATKLDLNRLGLTDLPESLDQLTQLRELELSNNQLTALPAWLGELTQLQKLDINDNQLMALPESLGQLGELRVLNLTRNHLMTLPGWINQLTKLNILGLGNNKLTKVPNSLCQLTQLEELYLWRNFLTHLPDSINQLKRLRHLELVDNKLSVLPESFDQLIRLQKLYLHGNDALGLPPEVLGPEPGEISYRNPASILDYYFRLRAGKRPLNEAKFILVGRGGVGKTSLINRLLFDHFDKDEKKTEGICISKWSLLLSGLEEVRLNIWDFGGQEILHATHQFFLTQRSLYLLVLEGRQGAEDADAEYWLKLIESFGTESSGEVSPVLVVLNKINENPFDLNRRGLQQKYPFIHGFVATDCADRTGLNELHAVIERETDQLKHLRDDFPTSWFAIKDKLARMKEQLNRSFISFDEYRALCAEKGEKEATAQDSLAMHLHNLGIALNYKDDPRLCDMHVLDPHWVTNGIYTILNTPLLSKQKGELRLTDIAQILDAIEYPRHMHRFLFDLMKKFQLCFTFPDDDSHYLIPELLDKQEATETEAFRLAECLNFEYRYPVLPEGLLPRFIVRTHSLSADLPRWRTGVVLEFEGNRALVKADVQDKRVFIAVSGPAAGRRRLLAIIRSDFERIHADISKLKPEALVPVPNQPKLAVSYARLLTFETKGIQTFPEAVGDDVLELDVQELLNGVDLEGTRKREKTSAEQSVKLFYSYSHKDESLRNELEAHLKLLQRTGLITEWHDRKIEAGDDWKTRIDENLERADIILLLVSADFIASDYCYEKEMKRAMERQAKGEAQIISIILRDGNYKLADFMKLQVLPKDGKAVTKWRPKDTAWRNVSEGIERVVMELRAKKRLD